MLSEPVSAAELLLAVASAPVSLKGKDVMLLPSPEEHLPTWELTLSPKQSTPLMQPVSVSLGNSHWCELLSCPPSNCKAPAV